MGVSRLAAVMGPVAVAFGAATDALLEDTRCHPELPDQHVLALQKLLDDRHMRIIVNIVLFARQQCQTAASADILGTSYPPGKAHKSVSTKP